MYKNVTIVFMSAILFLVLPNINTETNISTITGWGPSAAHARSFGGRSGGFRSPSRPSYKAPTRRAPSTRPKATTPAPRSKAPARSAINSSASAANRKQASKLHKAAAPRKSVVTSTGKHVQVAGTPAAKSVRTMSTSRYATRSARKDTAYRSIPPQRKVAIVNSYGGGFYGDPYSGLFMYSLLSMSLHNQAMFHHNHWGSYSQSRQAALMAENSQLRAEMATITTPADPAYAPAGVDKDLLYTDDFVEAAYNPAQDKVVEESKSGSSLVIFLGTVLLMGAGFGGWFIFMRKV